MGTRWTNFYVRSEDAWTSPTDTSPSQSPTCAGRAVFSGELSHSRLLFCSSITPLCLVSCLCPGGEWNMAPYSSRYLSQVGSILRRNEALSRNRSMKCVILLLNCPISVRDLDWTSLWNCLGLLEPIWGLSSCPFKYFFFISELCYLGNTTNVYLLGSWCMFDAVACCCCCR